MKATGTIYITCESCGTLGLTVSLTSYIEAEDLPDSLSEVIQEIERQHDCPKKKPQLTLVKGRIDHGGEEG